MCGVKALLKYFCVFQKICLDRFYGLAISNTSAHVCTLGHLPNFNSRFPVAQLLFDFPGATKHKRLYLLVFVAHYNRKITRTYFSTPDNSQNRIMCSCIACQQCQQCKPGQQCKPCQQFKPCQQCKPCQLCKPSTVSTV